MDKLVEAIKSFDIATVRKLLQSEQYLPNEQDHEIDTVLALAKTEGLEYLDKNGIKRIEVSLALRFGWAKQYTKSELKQLLVDLIGELSEDCYSTGWSNNIEFELWHLINHKSDEKTLKLWRKRGDIEALKDLKILQEITHSWAIWDDGAGKPISIMLEDWIALANSA